MHWIQNLLNHSNLPILTVFLLGIITAISPCPLATNITAIAYITKDIESKKRVFYSGLIYMLGGAISYFVLGIIFFFGANQFKIASFLQKYGGRIMGPLLIIIGLLMLDIIRFNLVLTSKFSERISRNGERGNLWKVLLIGIVFALAFCPYTGALFFGMLVPMTISNASGLYLPIFFALGTGLPVIIIAYLIAYTLSGIGSFYSKIKSFEIWFRRIIALVFIGAGVYYIFQFI